MSQSYEELITKLYSNIEKKEEMIKELNDKIIYYMEMYINEVKKNKNIQVMPEEKQKKEKEFDMTFMSIAEYCKRFSYFPEGGLRHLLHTNRAFRDCCSRNIGKKILIDVQAVERWIASQPKKICKGMK